MSTNKTKPTTRSVELFLDNLIPKQRKKRQLDPLPSHGKNHW